MKFEFICAEHEEYGSMGWRLKSQPKFDPLGGMAVAHDCLEHFSNDDSVGAEFMALGASLFVRDEYFYVRNGKLETCPGVHIASDMPDIMRHVLNEGYEFPKAPRTTRLDDRVEEWINRMFQAYRENIAEESDGDDLRLDSETIKSIRSYIRIGYRRASKRYRNESYEAQELFCRIEHEADRFLHSAQEGTELHVTVNFKDLTAKVAVFEHEHYEHYDE